jgi:hypothetical protein
MKMTQTNVNMAEFNREIKKREKVAVAMFGYVPEDVENNIYREVSELFSPTPQEENFGF